jgi:2-polyprenyl-3-methyl-5-hydroxy-6-metoxy-1,4-benzoquinol methylase
MSRRPIPAGQEAPDSDAIRSFYDAFTQKLVRDYIDGNVRQSRAFELVRSAIGPDTKTVLDVGCGIGASSASYVEGTDAVSVHGVDISPNNIRVATALFGGPRVRFSVSDMTSPPGDERYDLIALVDMHEHIPRASWPAFHATLARSLGDRGTLVMTTPSPAHQHYLRTNKPEGLQVVDETLELHDVAALARVLDATIIRYEWVGVWHTGDYVHTVISRAPRFDPIPRRARWVSTARSRVTVNRADDLVRRLAARVERGRRARHVRNALGVAISTFLLAMGTAHGSSAQTLSRDIAASPHGDSPAPMPGS